VIPLTRHLDPHLEALLSHLAIETRLNPAGGNLICDIITPIDIDAVGDSLRGYHLERWRRPPGGSGPFEIRLSDLGELMAALVLKHHHFHLAETIYPLTFMSPGPTAQPPGIDVLGVTIYLETGDLAPDERLTIAEAKSTLGTNASNAISGIQDDVKKCTAERVADSLFVLKYLYEHANDLSHIRLPLFVTSNAGIVASIVCDPTLCDVEATVASIFNRLEGKVSPTGAPLVRVVLLALPNAAALIQATL
jgi:hypothetical protein